MLAIAMRARHSSVPYRPSAPAQRDGLEGAGAKGDESSLRSATGFPWDLIRCQAGTRRVHGGDANVPVEHVVCTSRRLIPDVHAATAGNARGLLNGRIPNCDVAAHPGIRGGRQDHDPIGIAVGRIFFDKVIVPGKDPDAEVVVWIREAVSRRLVPPERVIVTLDSYTAAGQPRVGRAVSDRNVCFERDL